MTSQPLGELSEDRVRALASSLVYPRTPDISRPVAAAISRRRPAVRAWQVALAVLLLALAALLAIPQARALIGQYFRIGPIRILPQSPTGAPSPAPTTTLVPSELAGLAGRTTYAEARESAAFPVSFPSYPPGLDEPDFTFYQPNIPMLILAWRDPSDPQDLLMSLYILPSDSPWIAKYDPDIIEETSVDGQYALWVEGLHLLELDTGDFTHRRLVEGATLLWQVGGVTYRLESGLPMEEAIRVAESLEPLEP